jgi:hypothetical protein
VLAACGDAYCPKLAAPKPKACSSNSSRPSELALYMAKQIDEDVSAALTKSAVQTTIYAGFPDVTFLMCTKD